jgi:hypothetical protein
MGWEAVPQYRGGYRRNWTAFEEQAYIVRRRLPDSVPFTGEKRPEFVALGRLLGGGFLIRWRLPSLGGV